LEGEIFMLHRNYRSLQRECHIQAALTGHEKARQELEKMELEYKAIADWLERQQTNDQSPSKE
jgi:hypothetical protein